MILNEPGKFSENTDEQDPVASANKGLEYHEYLEVFLNPTVQHNVAKHQIYTQKYIKLLD